MSNDSWFKLQRVDLNRRKYVVVTRYIKSSTSDVPNHRDAFRHRDLKRFKPESKILEGREAKELKNWRDKNF